MAMTRRRYVTPEGFSREDLLSLPPAVRLTEIGLRLYADDHGRERVNARLMLAKLYPLDRNMTETTMEEHLLALDDADCVTVYDVGDRTYYSLTDWPNVDRPTDSQHPPPPSRVPRDSFVAGEREREREGEWERGGESGPARTDREGLPPSPFCPAHRATGGTDDPCRGCGRARLGRQVWDDNLMADAGGVRFEDAA